MEYEIVVISSLWKCYKIFNCLWNQFIIQFHFNFSHCGFHSHMTCSCSRLSLCLLLCLELLSKMLFFLWRPFIENISWYCLISSIFRFSSRKNIEPFSKDNPYCPIFKFNNIKIYLFFLKADEKRRGSCISFWVPPVLLGLFIGLP